MKMWLLRNSVRYLLRSITIGKYYIRTWDETYRPNVSMNHTIVHSDNTGMVFVAEKLVVKNFRNI